MSLPSEDDIKAHARAHGGLWRIIPRKGRPLFAALGAVDGLRTFENGDLIATVYEDKTETLMGAEWVPVDRNGDRV